MPIFEEKTRPHWAGKVRELFLRIDWPFSFLFFRVPLLLLLYTVLPPKSRFHLLFLFLIYPLFPIWKFWKIFELFWCGWTGGNKRYSKRSLADLKILNPPLELVTFGNSSEQVAPPGFCVDVRGLEKPVGWGPEHLGERGAWRRVRRLHQLRPRLPQGLHCSHWHLWCDKVGSSVNNQCIGNLEFPNGECFIVGIQKHCFKLIDNVAQEFDQLFTRSGILNFCAVAMSLHDMGYRPLVSNCLSKWHLLQRIWPLIRESV